MTRTQKLAKFIVDVVIPFCKQHRITIDELAKRVPPEHTSRLVDLISE